MQLKLTVYTEELSLYCNLYAVTYMYLDLIFAQVFFSCALGWNIPPVVPTVANVFSLMAWNGVLLKRADWHI